MPKDKSPEDIFWSFYDNHEKWSNDFVTEINHQYSILSNKNKINVSIGFHRVVLNLQRQELYDLCRIFNNGYCGDDRFSYFTRSMIYLGKYYCEKLIESPDLFFFLALDSGWGDYGFWIEDFGELENNDFCVMHDSPEFEFIKKSESELNKEYPLTSAFCHSKKC